VAASAAPLGPTDLIQEDYLRLLRSKDIEAIRTPEAYVFALANHVLCLHRLREAKRPQPTDVPDLLAEMDPIAENDPADQLEAQRRVEEFERALSQRSPRAEDAGPTSPGRFVDRRYRHSARRVAADGQETR
jgi:DNA-directed RNA polymerase specialized sigma24 family protein